jgi:hypothetical protein
MVVGVEVWSQPLDSVIAFKTEMGATFPLALQGYRAAQDYDAGNNYIFLIDQNGIIQDTVITASLTSYSAIDNAVKSLANKIPALLNASVRQWKCGPISVDYSLRNSQFHSLEMIDIRGRLLRAGANSSATQPMVIRMENARHQAIRLIIDR